MVEIVEFLYELSKDPMFHQTIVDIIILVAGMLMFAVAGMYMTIKEQKQRIQELEDYIDYQEGRYEI